MNGRAHGGFGLALAAPVAFVAVGAGQYALEAVTLATLAGTYLPDVAPPLGSNRDYAHSIAFVLGAGLAAGAITWTAAVDHWLWITGGVALGGAGHVFLDALDEDGVPLGWPIIDRWIALGVVPRRGSPLAWVVAVGGAVLFGAAVLTGTAV